MPKHALTDMQTDKQINMERERGRKSYFVHDIRQDVAILCLKYNTNSDKACFGPAPGEKDNHKKDPVSPGHAPYDFDTGITVTYFSTYRYTCT